MRFVPQNPDWERSPGTGLTRAHWVQGAEFLLAGIFSHVKSDEAPLVFPRRSAVAYPQPGASWTVLRAEEAEGLARTFLLVAPVLAENPDLQVGGRRLRDYYANHVLRACDPQSPCFWGRAGELAAANGGSPAQQLVEAAALCIGLMSCRAVIWDRYTPAERDRIAAWLGEFAHARTHPHNWRYFNVLIGAFLQRHGYAVDDALINGHLQALMAWYAGDGWYRDGSQFDYYSPWAFQFYGPIWCDWLGYERHPELARVIEQRHGELMANYPQFFGRGGESLLWGRSAIYRCAASAPLVTAFRLKNTPLDPGRARRIASGNLLQFIGRADLWQDRIPGLGFYQPFDAVLQGYSCAASPFWLAKIFQALVLPAGSPFWTATENEGAWPAIGHDTTTVVLDGPGLTASSHGSTGAGECRPGKVSTDQSLYQRLVFNTAFPWEENDPAGGTAMAYALRRLDREESFVTPSEIQHVGMRDGVLYRKLVFRFPGFSPGPAAIDLAEIILPGGVLRIDRLRGLPGCELQLGHFGLPHADGHEPEITDLSVAGRPALSASLGSRGLLFTAYRGWEGIRRLDHRGKNAEAETSTVLHAFRRCGPTAAGNELLVTLMLHRTDGRAWTKDEADPVAELRYHAWPASGSPAGLSVHFKNGDIRAVDFGALEGGLKT
jgi:hypothetical protein